jgi:hypothetical protein
MIHNHIRKLKHSQEKKPILKLDSTPPESLKFFKSGNSTTKADSHMR